MTREEVLARLQGHTTELRRMDVASLAPRSWRVRIEDILDAIDNIEHYVEVQIPPSALSSPQNRAENPKRPFRAVCFGRLLRVRPIVSIAPNLPGR